MILLHRLLLALAFVSPAAAQTPQNLLLISLGAPAQPTIQHHSVGPCSGASCTLTSQIIGTTGDAAYTTALGCWNSGCSTVTGCSMTVSDGTNTYTQVSAASNTDNLLFNLTFVASNATAGTRTVTYTAAGAGCSFNFAAVFWVDIGSAAASPIDTAVSNAINTGGSATSLSLTSAGNVAFRNELILVSGGCYATGTISSTGSYTQVDHSATSAYGDFSLSAPAAGATTTFAGACSASSTYILTMLGLHG